MIILDFNEFMSEMFCEDSMSVAIGLPNRGRMNVEIFESFLVIFTNY
jgi:hypothetical protein